jgi:hypothetical protein
MLLTRLGYGWRYWLVGVVDLVNSQVTGLVELCGTGGLLWAVLHTDSY